MSTAVFEDEVVTAAKVRYLRVPGLAGELALITLDNGHDHTRPSTFGPGGLASLDAALDEIAAHSPAPAAIGVTGKPFIFAVGADLSGVPSIADARAGPGGGRDRSPGVPPAQGLDDPDVRLRQRGGARRRPGAGAALPLPDHRDHLGGRLPGGVPRPGARLGRHAAAAEPDRHRPGGHRDRRERPGAEQDDAGPEGGEARHRRRRLRAGRLPGALARLGGRGARRVGVRRPARGRPRRPGTTRSPARTAIVAGAHPQRLARRRAGGRAARPGPARRRRRGVHRRNRRRGRRAGRRC